MTSILFLIDAIYATSSDALVSEIKKFRNNVLHFGNLNATMNIFKKKMSLIADVLLKSEQQHLYDIYWWMRTQLSWKKFFLVICKILGLFVNTLTADGKYSLLHRHNLLQHFQMILSQKQKTFSAFFCHLEI